VTSLQARDNEILRALTLKVRLFSLEQIAATWWQITRTGRDNARKRIALLSERGLIHRLHPLSRPLPAPERALVAWSPGDETPDHSALAWVLKTRFLAPARKTTCYVATRRAAALFGGNAPGELKHEHQTTHDLGLAAVYLVFRKEHPEREEEWLGEDVLRPHYRRKKLPDAVLASSPSATPEMLIEFGGAYDRRRLEEFHRDCLERNLPYEIW
jgi:hypothetical protein